MLRPSMALTAVLIVAACTKNIPPIPAPPQAQPEQSEATPYKCKADQMGDQQLVGKLEQDAAKLLDGCRWRVTERDGRHLPATMDYVPERRNLAISKGVVIKVRRG